MGEKWAVASAAVSAVAWVGKKVVSLAVEMAVYSAEHSAASWDACSVAS